MKPFLENIHLGEKINKYQYQDDAGIWIIWQGL